jgi:hypothetical protein
VRCDVLAQCLNRGGLDGVLRVVALVVLVDQLSHVVGNPVDAPLKRLQRPGLFRLARILTKPSAEAVTNSVSGNFLNLSWPADQNWILQTQTNSPSIGLSTNWVDVPGSSAFNSTNIEIRPSQPPTFYRLKR